MKFGEIQYTRPDVAQAAGQLEALADEVNSAGEVELKDVFKRFVQIEDDMETYATIASIRHTVDTRDAFYEGENDYFDEQGPVLEDKAIAFYRAVLASPHKGVLASEYGDILLEKMENMVKSSEEKLVPLQQKENALASTYQKLYASAKIPFQGQVLTVAQLGPYKQHIDRAVRKEAFEAEGGFFDAHREELDDIYSKLVQNRTEQGRLMGYENYIPLGDIRMKRLGYTRADIAACRAEVAKGVVPFAKKIHERQGQRIGVADLKFYDTTLSFKDGNPTPKGTPEEILAAGQKMYHELSPETAEFIDIMMEGDLFDVLAKPGKAPGGYCTYLPNYKTPFIFSNFQGTAADVDVLTHEAGHAFADYRSAKNGYVTGLRNPGLESCEIHSMSMEFLTAAYHHLFFQEDTNKYAISHAEDALCFLPYGCMVDEFQERVYAEPNLTPAQRNEYWLELERKYRPWVDFADLPFYARGAGWQRQLHIYHYPFYYIDYVLAQIIAFEFFLAAEADWKDAWQRYLALANKGGTASYTGLVEAAGFKTPFQPGVMEEIGSKVYDWISKRDA